MSEQARMSINLSEDAAAFVAEQMSAHGTSATETVRRALALLKMVEAEFSLRRRVMIGNRELLPWSEAS